MELNQLSLEVDSAAAAGEGGVAGAGGGGGRTLLRDFSYEFSRGERVGIVGGNGVGKSSFIKLLAGKMTATAGDVRVGETVVIGHYEQQGLDMPGDLTVLQVCVCERESAPVCLCVRERERVCVCVCVCIHIFVVYSTSSIRGRWTAGSTADRSRAT